MSVGLHVNLTAGRPVSEPEEVPSLVAENGMFHDHATFFSRANRCAFASSQLELEIRRQLQKIHDLGISPTHVDSHHHAASCIQPFFIQLRLLKEFGIRKMRTHRGWYHSDSLTANRIGNLLKTFKTNLRRGPYRVYYELQHQLCYLQGIRTPTERFGFKKVVSDKDMDFAIDCLPTYLKAMPTGINELCCHPGYLSNDPLDEPEFRTVRPRELDFFTNPKLGKALDEANVELISYSDF